jgi:hypothetical protein
VVTVDDLDKPVQSMNDVELNKAVWEGVAGAQAEESRRESDRQIRQHQMRLEEAAGRQPRPAGSGAGFELIWSLAVLALPVVVLVALITGLTRGTTWLAERSWLAPLFPAPGDSLARYVLSVCTLLALLPGGLLLLVARLDATPLRPLGRLVVLPIAVLSVPVILFVTQSTTGVDLIRLPA